METKYSEMAKVSSMCSDYYHWFVEMGYPLLDIVTFEDGEWAIREYQTLPVIPSLTKWRYILVGLKNIPITYGFVSKWVQKMDLTRQEAWDREEAKSRAVELEQEKREEHRKEFADKAFQAIRGNEDLMERVAQNGLAEINLENIAKHIPDTKLKSHLKQVKI
jgi:hypothetical protein